jgi:ankyrin repeat protein
MLVHSALVLLAASGAAATAPASDALLQAVRKGDVAAVKAALDGGVPVDAKFRYDRTALSFAADRGQLDVVTLLLERGADVNAQDSFYGVTPIVWAAQNGHAAVARVLLARGATGAGSVLESGVEKKSVELVEAAVASGKLGTDELSFALEDAEKSGAADVVAALRRGGAVAAPKADFVVDAATLARYAGRYREKDAPSAVDVAVADGGLQLTFGGPPEMLGAFDATRFRLRDNGRIRLTFKLQDGAVDGFTLTQPGRERYFAREKAAP